ncbi:MAG: oligoribonuclease [bacterium]|nr:oligoribonuclease [bacterium]
MASKSDAIVWVDCEMTGLDPEKDAIVEVAVIVTDSELTPLDDGIDLIVKPPAEALEQMNPVVRTMHTTSGLLDVLDDGLTLEETSKKVMKYVRKHVPRAGRAPLAGNSVGTDKMFLDRYLPELTGHLHYRIIDVSSIKELARRWYPRAYFASPEKTGGHRALADILESIDELRYYRAALFPAGEGPDSETAREIASGILASPTGRPAPLLDDDAPA